VASCLQARSNTALGTFQDKLQLRLFFHAKTFGILKQLAANNLNIVLCKHTNLIFFGKIAKQEFAAEQYQEDLSWKSFLWESEKCTKSV
jgi:hypothetical protein